MRHLVGLPVAILLTMVLVAPVLAAPPTTISFADDDVADGEFFSDLCGFDVWAESGGHVIFHNDKRGANNFISNWNIRIRLHSETGSYYLVDAGPDMLHRRAGTEYFTITGRSLTGSTVIGRVEINLDIEEVTINGKPQGSELFDLSWVCDELS